MTGIRDAFASLWQEPPKPTWGIQSPIFFIDQSWGIRSPIFYSGPTWGIRSPIFLSGISFSDIGKIAREFKDSIPLLWQEPPILTRGIKSPGLFSDIGKPARDILYHEYDSQLFSFTTLPILTCCGNTAITNSIMDGVFGFSVRHSFTRHLQASVAFIDDKTPAKLEVTEVNRHATLCVTTGLTANPTVTCSMTLVGRGFFGGSDISFDTRARAFTQGNFGVSFTHKDVIVALTLREMGDALSASYHHEISLSRFREFVWLPGTTKVAAELTHKFSTAETSLTFGVRHHLDDLTSVCARFKSSGKVMASLQHHFGYCPPRALVLISGEVDLGSCIGNEAKIGLAIAMQ